MVTSADLGDRLVETLHSVHGQHQGHRAAHAKGTCCTATFTATDAARALTRAAHFQAPSVIAKVRFSNGSGIPAYPDYARSDGRGIAVKFDLPDGTHADMVGLTLPVFFARDAEAFMEFLSVTRPDPETRQPDLARVGEFLERHPETQAALGAAMSGELPASYLTVAYNSLHAFGLEDAEGRTTWARYRWEPELGEVAVSSDEARAGGRDYLQDELRARLSAGPVGLRLKFILAHPSDSLIDPTSAWPPDREVVDAGRLEVTAVAAEACEGVVFDPTNVVDGIVCSDDPILHARSVAYARSFADRRGITAPAAAPPGDAAADTGTRALESAASLGDGAMMAVDIAGVRVAVARVGGELHAFQDTCTHRGCSLADGRLSGTTVSCPCHGSQFDVVTGEVLRGPAKDNLQTFA